jgi:hypothetical protein
VLYIPTKRPRRKSIPPRGTSKTYSVTAGAIAVGTIVVTVASFTAIDVDGVVIGEYATLCAAMGAFDGGVS